MKKLMIMVALSTLVLISFSGCIDPKVITKTEYRVKCPHINIEPLVIDVVALRYVEDGNMSTMDTATLNTILINYQLLKARNMHTQAVIDRINSQN